MLYNTMYYVKSHAKKIVGHKFSLSIGIGTNFKHVRVQFERFEIQFRGYESQIWDV